MFLVLLPLRVTVAYVFFILLAVVSLLFFFFVPLVFRGSRLFVCGAVLSMVVVFLGSLLFANWLSLRCGRASGRALFLLTSYRLVPFTRYYCLRLFAFPIRGRPSDYVVACLIPTVCTVNLIIRLQRCLISSNPNVIFCARHQLTFCLCVPLLYIELLAVIVPDVGCWLVWPRRGLFNIVTGRPSVPGLMFGGGIQILIYFTAGRNVCFTIRSACSVFVFDAFLLFLGIFGFLLFALLVFFVNRFRRGSFMIMISSFVIALVAPGGARCVFFCLQNAGPSAALPLSQTRFYYYVFVLRPSLSMVSIRLVSSLVELVPRGICSSSILRYADTVYCSGRAL